MRLYFEVARRSFQRATTYRTAYLAGMLTNSFFGAVRSFVYIAVYTTGSTVAGFSLADAISYTWITQMLISIGGGWISGELGGTIRTGEVVTDLSRPWNFYGYWFSRTVGGQVFNVLVRGSLTYLVGVVFFGAYVPSPFGLLMFVLAVALAMVVSFAFSFLVHLTAFWLIDNTGVILIANILLSFFSGMMLPLNFFPPVLANIARALPFQAISALPAEIFLEHVTGAALVQTFLLQFFWAVLLTLAGLGALRAAMHKVVVQGG